MGCGRRQGGFARFQSIDSDTVRTVRYILAQSCKAEDKSRFGGGVIGCVGSTLETSKGRLP